MTARRTVGRAVCLCIAALRVNVRFCRSPRFGLSHISWRTSVAHHPTEDKEATQTTQDAECHVMVDGLASGDA